MAGEANVRLPAPEGLQESKKVAFRVNGGVLPARPAVVILKSPFASLATESANPPSESRAVTLMPGIGTPPALVTLPVMSACAVPTAQSAMAPASTVERRASRREAGVRFIGRFPLVGVRSGRRQETSSDAERRHRIPHPCGLDPTNGGFRRREAALSRDIGRSGSLEP